MILCIFVSEVVMLMLLGDFVVLEKSGEWKNEEVR